MFYKKPFSEIYSLHENMYHVELPHNFFKLASVANGDHFVLSHLMWKLQKTISVISTEKYTHKFSQIWAFLYTSVVCQQKCGQWTFVTAKKI